MLCSRIVLCFFLAACSKAPEMPPKVVEIESVKREPFHFSIRLVGVIKPKYESVLTARVAGAVDIHVNAGDMLKKGDVIASIQNADAMRNYELAEKEATIARENYERVKYLGEHKTMSRQDVDTKRIEVIRAEKQAFEAKKRLEDSQFIAPFDGVVGVFKMREGAHMNAGDVLVTFYQPQNLVVTFDIPEEFVSKTHPGQKTMISGKEFSLTAVQKLIDPESHMGPAYINYECTDCLIGSNTDVELILYEGNKDISIPKDAVYYKGDKANGMTFVYLAKEGKTVLHPVKVGYTHHERTQILEGLNENDPVISKGITRLFPGMDVVIHESKENDTAKDNTDTHKKTHTHTESHS